MRDTVENRAVIQKYDLRNRKLANGLIGLFDRWIEMNPRSIALVLVKGELLMNNARWVEARRTYEEALKIEPANVLARERLRQLSVMKGR